MKSGFIFLFGCGIFFISCSGPKILSQKNIDIAKYSNQLADSLAAKQAAGFDISATGNEPVKWQLDMDLDKIYNFSANDGNAISTMALGASTTTGNAVIYNCNTPKGAMQVTVYNELCNGSNTKKIEVILNQKKYNGCAKNLYDYRLNDKWILETAESKSITKADFPKEIPYIIFDVAQNKLTGNDGCSTINCNTEIIGNRIKFGNIPITKNNCKNAAIQKIFLEKISNQNCSYYFNNGKLYLYLIDDSILIFKKDI